jgi:hypothetical protein
MEYNPTYIQSACMPTAFTQNPTLSTMENPFNITGAEEIDQTASSNEAAVAVPASAFSAWRMA